MNQTSLVYHPHSGLESATVHPESFRQDSTATAQAVRAPFLPPRFQPAGQPQKRSGSVLRVYGFVGLRPVEPVTGRLGR